MIDLVEHVAEFGRTHDQTVKLEGIFSKKKYGEMLAKLASTFDEVHAYYFDIPFEETLKRHVTKPNAHEFGEKEMREWWHEKDYLMVPAETIIDENASVNAIAELIVMDSTTPVHK